jgi:hypothetical protein
MSLLIPPDDKLRHAILGELVKVMEDANDKSNNELFERASASIDYLSKRLNVSQRKIREVSAMLLAEKDATYFEIPKALSLDMTENTAMSYVSRKYIARGRAYRLGLIKEWATVIGIAIAAIVGVANLNLACNARREAQTMQKQIETLRQEVQKAKAQSYQSNPEKR